MTKTGPHSGWAKVTGYYGNVGNIPLSATQGQAYAQLWETWPGEKPVMVNQLVILNAPANGLPLNNNLTFARKWDAVNGREASKPPTYKVVYVHEARSRTAPRATTCSSDLAVTSTRCSERSVRAAASKKQRLLAREPDAARRPW